MRQIIRMLNRKKIVTVDSFPAIKKKLGKKTVVLVGGCFDVFHFGHLCFLEKAKQEGEVLVVALESDAFIHARKKRKPLHSQEQRAHILAALTMVGFVIMMPFFKTDSEYSQFVKKISPAVIAITEGDPLLEKKREQAQEIKGMLKVVCPLIGSFSTSKIITYASFSRN